MGGIWWGIIGHWVWRLQCENKVGFNFIEGRGVDDGINHLVVCDPSECTFFTKSSLSPAYFHCSVIAQGVCNIPYKYQWVNERLCGIKCTD